MNTEITPTNVAHSAECNSAELHAKRMLEDLFSKVFGKVVVLTNLILPTGPNSAVKTAEIDALVICNAGIIIFEVKGWHNCTVVRGKNEMGDSIWSLNSGGYKKTVRDPLQQVGGKLKVIAPLIHDALRSHIECHKNELSCAIDALSSEKLGDRVAQSVPSVAAKILKPNIRARSYVLLPMGGVELGMNIPPNVVCSQELAFLIRQLVHESKRDKGYHIVFTDSMVDRVAQTLRDAGTIINVRQHLENVHAVHGGCEEALASTI